MKSDLPILDAEFIDLPAPQTPQGNAIAPRKGPTKAPKVKKPPKAATAEGRVDKLVGGLLTVGFGNMTGSAPPPQVAESIQKATTMILGKSRAKGPEWDFLKSLMGG